MEEGEIIREAYVALKLYGLYGALLKENMTDWIGKTRRNNPLRRKAAEKLKAGPGMSPISTPSSHDRR